MAAGADASAEPKLWVVVLSFIIYGTLNLFLNFFNKWAMAPSGAGFGLPVFYSTWHMLMSILGSLVLMLWKKPESGIVSLAQFKEYKWETLTLAVCTTVNISCNNASLMLIGLFVNQIIKALSPMIVMAMSYFVLKRRYGAKLITSVVFIAIGAVMAVPFKDPSVTVLGIVLVGLATMASSLKPVVGELLMTSSDKPKLAPAALVFYDSCFSFVFMLVFWLSVPAEREGSITYMREKPAMGWGIILIGSFAAFAYNMSIYNFTKMASAVAVMVTTNLLKVRLPVPHTHTAHQPAPAASAWWPTGVPHDAAPKISHPLGSRVPHAGAFDHGGRGCRGHPRPDQLDRDRNILRLGHRIRLLVLPGQAGGEEGGDGSRGQAHRNQQLGNQVTCLPSPPLPPASYVIVERSRRRGSGRDRCIELSLIKTERYMALTEKPVASILLLTRLSYRI